MGFESSLIRLDVYPKFARDDGVTKRTLTGALISVVCCTAILLLIFSEVNRYLAIDLTSTVYVDNPNAEGRIPVILTVELPNIKCQYVGLDIQDDMGRHEVGFVDNVEKTPMSGEDGCLFHASFQINKVPGNFHISTHSSKEHLSNPDFSHRIVEVRMGDNILTQNVPGSFNPLQNAQKTAEYGIESHDYIMKIVPTVYETRSGKSHISYQYTYAYRTYIGRGSSAIWFRYDLSPLTVKYRERGEPLVSFLTAICAVVGGIFTVAGIIDGLIFTGQEMVKRKKQQIGKQG